MTKTPHEPVSEDHETFEIEIPEDVLNFITESAAKEGISVDEYISKVIRCWLRGNPALQGGEERSPARSGEAPGVGVG